MKYQEYLNTEHWKSFRESVYLVRKICQKCGRRKRLNLHHKNYKCLWSEKPNDVIVLCQECHYKEHKRKKWIKAMREGAELDFTGVAQKERDRPIFKMGETRRLCLRCSEHHPIFYRLFSNGIQHLAMACPNSNPRIVFLPYEKNLDIPVTLSRKLSKGVWTYPQFDLNTWAKRSKI